MLSKSKKLVVSLFCGVGGLDLGFQSAGFEVAVAIDNNPKVLELYRLNFPDTLILCRDISDISAIEIREIIQNKYKDWDGEIAVVIGGPPCQGFSVAGKQDVNDERSQLVIKFIDLVVALNPQMFVMENVPAIESKKFESITGNAWSLASEHYNLSKWLLTASDYGVPQKRKRCIWVGSLLAIDALNGEMRRTEDSVRSLSHESGRAEYSVRHISHCDQRVIAPPIQSNKIFRVGDALSDLNHIPHLSHTDTCECSQKGEYAQYLESIFPSKSRISTNIISGCRATAHNTATVQK
ncbi:MAG: DNA cytosine methyltransferase, partial [Richelia sp. RM2_1_2]|nr:DNA cytosine methyltransferase [Richelia sp. RM2_1_2]